MFALLNTAIILGGLGKVVQIDKSLFVHTRKVATIVSHFIVILCYLQKGRGRPPVQEQWVFGMVDTSSRPVVGYMELVQDRTAAKLLVIISAHIAPGTEIWSDRWASYHNVGRIPGMTAQHTVPLRGNVALACNFHMRHSNP